MNRRKYLCLELEYGVLAMVAGWVSNDAHSLLIGCIAAFMAGGLLAIAVMYRIKCINAED